MQWKWNARARDDAVRAMASAFLVVTSATETMTVATGRTKTRLLAVSSRVKSDEILYHHAREFRGNFRRNFHRKFHGISGKYRRFDKKRRSRKLSELLEEFEMTRI